MRSGGRRDEWQGPYIILLQQRRFSLRKEGKQRMECKLLNTRIHVGQDPYFIFEILSLIIT